MRLDLLRSELLVLMFVVLLAGCSSKPTGVQMKNDSGAIVAEEVLSKLGDRVRRENTAEACRALLQQVDAQLSSEREKRAKLTPEQIAELAGRFLLLEEESNELARVEFTALDANYLAECLLYRDAVRSLELDGFEPKQKADLAFAWVIRQISPEKRTIWPTPPMFTARSGSGDGLERAYVFLLTLQQLGLDACLIGPPASKNRATTVEIQAGQTQPSPFWAVGVRIDKDIHLFDTWSGVPVGTLAQLRSKPESFKPWLDAAKHIESKDVAQLATAEVFLTVPLSSLAPRLGVIEQNLAESNGVKLVLDSKKLHDVFKTATDANVSYWNPEKDGGTYMRALGQFLPFEDGGFARGAPGTRPYDAFRQLLFPWDTLPRSLRNLQAEGAVEAKGLIAAQYVGAFFLENGPHEKLVRGQYNEVIRSLSALREDMTRMKELADRQTGLEDALQTWVNDASAAYAELSRAKRKNDPIALQTAQAKIADLQKKSEKFQLYLMKLTSEQFLMEGTYLLALCKHEQAERSQTRLDHMKNATPADRDATKETWKSGYDWWQQFLRGYGQSESLYPERFAQVRKLAERANAMSK